MLYYAGIGSRETPDYTLNIMRNVATYMAKSGWVLRSGGANGADKAFEEGAGESLKEIYLPWKGYNGNESPYYPEKYPFIKAEMLVSELCHPAWDKCSRAAKLLHARNVRIVLGMPSDLKGRDVDPVKFIVAYTKDGAVRGGTGQALRLAAPANIPVFNFGSCKTEEDERELLLKIIQEMEKYNV